MPPHSIGSGTISFGLVSIPVRMYTAAAPGGVSFNLLHARCGGRIRQQTFCPACNEVVGRGDLVRGYEFAKDQYVRFTDEELRALEGEASRVLDISGFVPLASVDPIYFEKTYYLGPDKGGEKAYRLLADALARTERAALATFVMRGKESLVLIRSARQGLLLHTLYFADEVRDFGEVDKGLSARIREGELDLALRLIEDLARPGFEPERYRDEYRERVLAAVQAKVEGREVTAAGPEARRAQVIDLMEALKQSLARRGAAPAAPAAAAAGAATGRRAPASEGAAPAVPGPAAPLAKKPPAKVARGAPAAQARAAPEAKPAARSRSARGR